MDFFDRCLIGVAALIASSLVIWAASDFLTASNEYIEKNLSKTDNKECVLISVQHSLQRPDAEPLKRKDIKKIIRLCEQQNIKSNQLEALKK